MTQIQLCFCRSRCVSSRVIRFLTWSKWSHVAIVYGDMVVEAWWPRVRYIKLSELLAQHDETQLVTFPCKDPLSGWYFACAQMCKRYDWRGLFSFIFKHNTADRSKWFCSELAAATLAAAGSPRFRTGSVPRVSPQHLWMLNPGDTDETP